jgi:hypothetical protein
MLQEQFCNLDGCLGVHDAQQRLQAGGLAASAQLTTRLLVFQRLPLRLTWSALESLLGESQALLKLPQWRQEPLPLEELQQLLEPAGLVVRRSRTQGYELLSADEVWLESQETALVPMATQDLVQAMVAPSYGGGQDPWPESWRVVADAEDNARILEHLRSAFRQTRAQGGSPAPLLWLALKRRRPEVTREVARLTYEYLDPDAGRHLEALFSPIAHVSVAALKQLRGPTLQNWDLPFLVGLLQILWEQEELRLPILDVVEELTPRWQLQPHLILSWWEECLAQTAQLEPLQVQRVAQISLHWARLGLDLVPALLRRLQRGLALPERLLASWLLGQLDLQEDARALLLEQAWELAAEPSLAGQSLLRVQQILTNLGHPALAPLLDPLRFQRLQPDLRCWLVAQAMTYLDLNEAAEALALQELAAGSRRMLRQLASQAWTYTPSRPLEESLRWTLAGFLEQEIPHLEEPDDAWAIALLVELDPDILERQYQQARRDAEVNSRAFPVRLETLAKHCAASDRAPQSDRLQRLLEASPFHAERPEMWRAWALLYRCPSFPPELRTPVLEHLQQGQAKFPQLWPEWWEEMQRSPVPAVRLQAEQDLLGVIRATEVPRHTVQSVLLTLLRRVDHWNQAQPLVQALSQRLLFLPPDLSPQQRMRWALAQSSEGDGVLAPQSWDAEQRDLALGLMGRLAQSPHLGEDLKRPLRVRCWQFLRDWLDGVSRGGDSYQHRSMPLWTTARLLLPEASEAEAPLTDEIAEQVVTLQGSCPERLRLLTHGDCLGFLLDWSQIGPSEQLLARQRMVLQVMQQLLATSDRDYRPVAVGYLVSLRPQQLHPGVQGEWQRLRQRWEGWLYGE